MTAESEGTPVRARSVWMILTPSGDHAGLTLDREQALRRARVMGGMVAEMIVVADFRVTSEADPLRLG